MEKWELIKTANWSINWCHHPGGKSYTAQKKQSIDILGLRGSSRIAEFLLLDFCIGLYTKWKWRFSRIQLLQSYYFRNANRGCRQGSSWLASKIVL